MHKIARKKINIFKKNNAVFSAIFIDIFENITFEIKIPPSNPANPDATHWTTYHHELDLGDLSISNSDFTKMVFASIIMTEAAGKALTCPGVKVAYKRTKVAV